ncbi:AMP-binding protein [Bacillus sonorensis]|nr:AMP-binding protein [Bacillus sonorensis]
MFEEEKLTYRELNERSNQLAGLLRELGVTPNKIVGVMAERSAEMIIGIMAVLKSGGAYLPIDPEYPEDRIKYMLEDSGIDILLKKTGRQINVDLTCIDMGKQGLTEGRCTDNLPHFGNSSDMAYVIYTSGSTKQTKRCHGQSPIDCKHAVLEKTIVSIHSSRCNAASAVLCI